MLGEEQLITMLLHDSNISDSLPPSPQMLQNTDIVMLENCTLTHCYGLQSKNELRDLEALVPHDHFAVSTTIYLVSDSKGLFSSTSVQ